jgi:hypothetical protein
MHPLILTLAAVALWAAVLVLADLLGVNETTTGNDQNA